MDEVNAPVQQQEQSPVAPDAPVIAETTVDDTPPPPPAGDDDGAPRIAKALHPSQLVEGQKVTGVVTRVQDSFGFIRSPALSEELFFHISALLPPSQQQKAHGMRKVKQNINTLISLGDKVQAIAGADHNRSGARMIGKQVTILQKATSETTTAANQNADGDHHEVQGVEDPVAPATATARAGGRQGHHAAGGRVAPRRDPIPLPGSQGKRELGTVTVCKQHFGFIKCVERMGDLFFHESAVRRGEDGEAVDKVGPGDDVEFSVGQDPKTKQKIAYDIIKVPKGSAVFDTISEQLYEGTVIQRLSLGRDYTVVSAGVIEYQNAEKTRQNTMQNTMQKITFGAQDLAHSRINPQLQERVVFRIAVNVRAASAAKAAGSQAQQHAGRRAVEVSPLRYTGRIVTIRDHFGFISCPDLPTEADAVSRWEHKGAATPPPHATGPAEDGAGGEHGDGDDNGAGGVTGDGATTEDAAAPQQQQHVFSDFHHGGGKKKKKRSQVFFSRAEVEGDATQLQQGDEVDFVLGINKGERVARRVRFKSRQERAEQPVLPKMLTPSATGERPRLFLHAPQRADGAQPTPPQPMYQPKHPDGTRGFTFGRGRGLPKPEGPLSRAASAKLDPSAPAFVPRSMSLGGTSSGEDAAVLTGGGMSSSAPKGGEGVHDEKVGEGAREEERFADAAEGGAAGVGDTQKHNAGGGSAGGDNAGGDSTKQGVEEGACVEKRTAHGDAGSYSE